MKKIIAISMSILMLAALCACGTAAKGSGSAGGAQSSASQPAPDTSAPDTTAPDTTAPDATAPDTAAPDATSPDTAAPDTSAADELAAILKDAADNYHTGVSGSSLNAAKYAGQLLDWNVSAKLSADDIKTATHDFFAQLGQDASVDFVEKFADVYAAAQMLCADNAQDLLDSCGYEAQSFPWTEADMTALFTAIYAGLAVDMPQAGDAA